MLSDRKVYADIFNNLDKHPISDDLAVKTNENAVKQSIRNLLLTDKGERLFQPNVGADIRKMLFENITPQTITVLEQMVRDTLETYEPRANIIEVVVSGNEDSNRVSISILFNVINRQEPVSIDVVLDRVR